MKKLLTYFRRRRERALRKALYLSIIANKERFVLLDALNEKVHWIETGEIIGYSKRVNDEMHDNLLKMRNN